MKMFVFLQCFMNTKSYNNSKWYIPLTVTKPIPTALAFCIARSMANRPIAGPTMRDRRNSIYCHQHFLVMIHNVYDNLILDSTLCFVWLPRMLFPSTRAVATVCRTISGAPAPPRHTPDRNSLQYISVVKKIEMNVTFYILYLKL